jgi:hypothetical protein
MFGQIGEPGNLAGERRPYRLLGAAENRLSSPGRRPQDQAMATTLILLTPTATAVRRVRGQQRSGRSRGPMSARS